jgi:hypothetical protein
VTEPLIRYPFTTAGLRDAMLALGTSLDAIRRNLEAADVRGRRGPHNECDCALAIYLRQVVTGLGTVHIYLDDHDSEVYAVAVRVLDGRPCGRAEALVGGSLPIFVRLFDRGDYPELEVSDAAA